MVKYDEKKVKRFNEFILNEYYRDSFIEKLTEVGTTDRTDGTFVQIGIRPLIDEGIFSQPSYASELIMAGSMISIGERDFLVKTLLNDQSIERIKIKSEEFTSSKLQEALGSLNAKILISVDTKTNLLRDGDWMNNIDFKTQNMRFNSFYDMFLISSNTAAGKIIILDELAIIWIKQLFQNQVTGKKEKLDIQIGKAHSDGKVDVLIRSVNKLHYFSNYIKIIEIE